MRTPDRPGVSLLAAALLAGMGANLVAGAVLLRPHLDLLNYYEWSALQNAIFLKSDGVRNFEVVKDIQSSGFDVVMLYGPDGAATALLANPSTRPYLKVSGPRPSLHLTRQGLQLIQDRAELGPEVEEYLETLMEAP